jgi:menaquinol-cytochrome c reductase iron-sulfur subunit
MFLSTPIKLSLGVTGFLAGSSGLFYYGAVKQRGQITKERPGNIVELGDTNQLTTIQGIKKVSYEAIIQDAWVSKTIQGFVYLTTDESGKLLILSPVCTHLGCTLKPATEMESTSTKDVFFRCPCHGAEFNFKGNGIGNGRGLPNLDSFEPIIVNNIVYFDILSPKKSKE